MSSHVPLPFVCILPSHLLRSHLTRVTDHRLSRGTADSQGACQRVGEALPLAVVVKGARTSLGQGNGIEQLGRTRPIAESSYSKVDHMVKVQSATRHGLRATGVCIVCFPYIPSESTGRGIDRYAFEIVRGLERERLHVDILHGWNRFPNTLQFVRQTALFCLRALRANNSVYHALDPVGSLPYLLVGKRPLAVTVHDWIAFSSPAILKPRPARLRFYVTRLLTHLCLTFASVVFVPFESTRQAIARLHPSAASRIRVVPYGLSSVKTHEVSSQVQIAPIGGSRNHSSKKLLFIGGGQPIVRGGLVCLQALHSLKAQGKSLRLTLVATGPEVSLVRFEAMRLGLLDDVDFAGPIPEEGLLDYIRGFDVFVYPSALGFSFLVLQAMSVGTPVIVSDDRDMTEFIGDAGVVCSRDRPNDFVTAIRKLVDDPRYREEMRARALARAGAFSNTRMTEKLLHEYSRLDPSSPR